MTKVIELLQAPSIDKKDLEALIAHKMGVKPLDIYLDMLGDVSGVEALIERRLAGEPVDYIVGTVDFCNHSFEVTPDVLIPRIETEFLVHYMAKLIPEGAVVWDICTGSGCIGISLKRMRPDLSVCLSDICGRAADVARSNADELEIEIFEGDLFEAFEDQMADAIVANPPYIPDGLVDNAYEPRKALAGGKDGLDFYRRFALEAPKYLNPKGKLFFEIDDEKTQNLFDSLGRTRVIQDLFEKDRFLVVETR
ncbi:MAG: Release factor glutamine methyltransferase [Chlamydiia bacterium]|nr:Release factor glutamine methyltransferase [Chlamydiia bacterium]MCH9615952.1 Release factor glutamine methyltransferase [Chlamydiia bacterium]MCH9628645.1 Release factor glutamine methyltransferase [Chlamydiia bacterium]